jgi:uncharacterized protein (DUF433 family)
MLDPDARIVLDPAILSGKPIVRGTRISVAHVVGLLAQGWTASTILDQHPTLSQDDIAACLAYAHRLLESERVFPSAA